MTRKSFFKSLFGITGMGILFSAVGLSNSSAKQISTMDTVHSPHYPICPSKKIYFQTSMAVNYNEMLRPEYVPFEFVVDGQTSEEVLYKIVRNAAFILAKAEQSQYEYQDAILYKRIKELIAKSNTRNI